MVNWRQSWVLHCSRQAYPINQSQTGAEVIPICQIGRFDLVFSESCLYFDTRFSKWQKANGELEAGLGVLDKPIPSISHWLEVEWYLSWLSDNQLSSYSTSFGLGLVCSWIEWVKRKVSHHREFICPRLVHWDLFGQLSILLATSRCFQRWHSTSFIPEWEIHLWLFKAEACRYLDSLFSCQAHHQWVAIITFKPLIQFCN